MKLFKIISDRYVEDMKNSDVKIYFYAYFIMAVIMICIGFLRGVKK